MGYSALCFTVEKDGSFGLILKKSPFRTFISRIQVKFDSVLCDKLTVDKLERDEKMSQNVCF